MVRVYGNRVLGEVFVGERGEGTGDWRILRSERAAWFVLLAKCS